MEDLMLDFSLMYLECVKQKNIKEFQNLMKEIALFTERYPYACISCLFENLNAIYAEGVRNGMQTQLKS